MEVNKLAAGITATILLAMVLIVYLFMIAPKLVCGCVGGVVVGLIVYNIYMYIRDLLIAIQEMREMELKERRARGKQ